MVQTSQGRPPWDGATTLLSNGMNYQPPSTGDRRISLINSMTLGSFFGFKIPRYHRVRIPDFMAECDLPWKYVGDMEEVNLKRWDDLLFIVADGWQLKLLYNCCV